MGEDRRLAPSAAATILVLAAAACASSSGPATRPAPAPADGPCAYLAPDHARLRRADTRACPAAAAPLLLGALRDEIVAFQVIVQAGPGAPLAGVTVDVDAPAGAPLVVDRFVEHFVAVRTRSRSPGGHQGESLGWLPSGRPDDAAILGELPDALVPVAEAGPDSPAPYPVAVPAAALGAVWVDVRIATDAPPGPVALAVRVRAPAAGLDVTLPVTIFVGDARLPARVVSFFASYEGEFEHPALAPAPPGARERELFALLADHGVDALVDLRREADVERLAPAMAGAWTASAPGGAQPPAVAVIGGYGSLGEPTPEKLALALALAARVPAAIADVFVYAIDETCASPFGPTWRKLLAGARAAGDPVARRPLMAGHTCHTPAAAQDVDLTLQPADTFDRADAAAARAKGTRVWVYNGRLPRAPTLLLDAPPSSALAVGWVLATYDVDRWFLWAVDFWTHGHGKALRRPHDVYSDPESFHNKDGDVALGDGMVIYPGTSLWPSMRLKRLRRGLQDAALLALVAADDVERAHVLARWALPRALDEVAGGAKRGWSDDGETMAAVRVVLRALVPAGAAPTPAEARAAITRLRAKRAP